MEKHNARVSFAYFIDQPQKMIRKNTFYAPKGISLFQNNSGVVLIHFGPIHKSS